MLDSGAFESLKSDIAQHGQQVPIVVWQGKVLDGRNRMRACGELGIAPKILELNALPGNSPTFYVISANLHRRQLKPSQLAMIGARARAQFDAEAKLRQSRKLGSASLGDARDLAGQAVGVSGKTIDYACKVLLAGSPELIAACEAGTLAVSTAARFVNLPPEQQSDAMTKRARCVAVSGRSNTNFRANRSKGAGFDQLVMTAREMCQLLESIGSPATLVDTRQFDRTVVLNAVGQLEAIADAIRNWTKAAAQQLNREALLHGS
jgi:hypothetical protein